MELDVTMLMFSEGSMKLQGEKAEVHEALVAIGQKRTRIESADARWVKSPRPSHDYEVAPAATTDLRLGPLVARSTAPRAPTGRRQRTFGIDYPRSRRIR